MERPTRLVHEDPEFSRLVAASNKQTPRREQIERALSLATRIATTSRSASWRWLGPNLAIGLAVIGVAVFGVVVGTVARRSGDTVAPSATSTTCGAAPCAPEEPDEAAPRPNTIDEAAPTMTVSVNDLAPAATRQPAAKAAAAKTATVVGVAAPSIDRARPEASRADPGATGTTFAEELAMVASARSALEANDVSSCMRAVRRYQERFGAGTFAHEIEVLRMEALFASGERAGARVAAERFLAANARSPYADRVRSLIERSNP